MKAGQIAARLVESRLEEALGDSPAVLLHGPRQCGKTTLARRVGDRRGYAYLSFDDEVLRTTAAGDPAGFVGDLPARVILDEVQRVPSLFTALKVGSSGFRVGRASMVGVPAAAEACAPGCHAARFGSGAPGPGANFFGVGVDRPFPR